MELMPKDGVLDALQEDEPPEVSSAAVINKFKKQYKKARAHIVLNLGKEPAMLVTSLWILGAATKAVWNKLPDSYEKENIQSKHNLGTKLHIIKLDNKSDKQGHITWLEETFLTLARLNDALDDKDKAGILLRSLPDEFRFYAIMADSQQMDYESIFAVLKASANTWKDQESKRSNLQLTVN